MELNDKLIKSLCSSTIYKRGLEYFRQGRVHIKCRDEDKLSAVVDGEGVYNVQIKMKDDKITDYYCSCPYFDTMNTVCKHIAATMMQRQAELEGGADGLADDNEKLAASLCSVFGETEAEKSRVRITFEVSALSKGFGEWSYGVRIVLEGKLLDSPESFIECVKQKKDFRLNRGFQYSPAKHFFSKEEEEIIFMLVEAYESRNISDVIYKKAYGEIPVGEVTLKRILNKISACEYSFIFNRMNMGKTEIIGENPDILVDVSASDGEILLYSGSYGTALTSDGGFFYYEDCIYQTDEEWQSWFMPIYQRLAKDCRTQLSFKGENAMSFATYVLPKISSKHGVITDGIETTVINEKPKFEVYLDRNGREIICTVKASYGDISLILPEAVQINTKIVVRDLKGEEELLGNIKDFDYSGGYYRTSDDEVIFDFLKNRMKKIARMARVITSNSFDDIKIYNRLNLGARVDYDENSGLLEASLESDLSYEEIRDILSAVKTKKQFYRLGNGSFADLFEERSRIEMMLRLGLEAKDLEIDKKVLPRYQLLYFNAIRDSEKDTGIAVSDNVVNYVERLRNKKLKLSDNLNKTLRGYQKEGVNWLKQLSMLGLGGILADDMGLGKTLQILAFLYTEKPQKPVLIVTPSSLTYNWRNEMEKFIPDASVMIIDGNGKEREELIEQIGKYDFLITSYPLLRRDIEKYADVEFSYCIIDEAQSIKNPRTMNAISVKQVKAEHKFALTGTPIENALSELWSVFDFLMPGYLYKSSEFKEWFETPIINNSDENAADELRAKIAPFILRRMKRDVLSELPDKIENTVYADMAEEQKNLYAAYQAAAKERALAILAEGKQGIEILTLLMRLRQISCHPSLFDMNYKGDSGKLEVLIETVGTAILSGHRILIFSQFTSMLAIIKDKLKAEGIDYFYLDGNTPSERRTEMAERFNGGERDIFLISLKAGGFGLNLVGADMVIHYDPWWNPAVTEQASDRAYRIGQTKNVQVIRLVSKNTIEEKILMLSEKKKRLAENMIDDIKYGLSDMSTEEILSLFD